MTRRCCWGGIALLVLGACGGAGAGKRSITSVIVSGNQKVDSDELLDGVANHPPSGIVFKTAADYEPLELQLDQRRIETSYREHGFFSAKVLDAEVRPIGADEVAITFRVQEGPPSILEAIEVSGGPDEAGLRDRELADRVPLQLGRPVDYQAYQDGANQIRAELLRRGYAYAQVESTLEVDRDRGSARALYRVDAGPVAYFGTITVEGLERTDESLVTNRLTFATGERFDPVKLEKSKQRIRATGLVGDVRYAWDVAKKAERLDLTIRASEGLRHEIRVGGGVGVQRAFYELRARLGYSHRNFLDNKATLRAGVTPGLSLSPNGGFIGVNVGAEVALDREDFLWPLLKASWSLEYALTEIPAYAHQGPTARFAVGRTFFDDRLITSIGLQYRYQNFLRIEPEVQALASSIGLDDPLTFASLEPSITYDGRDNPQSPQQGVYARLRLEGGQVLSGQSRSYLRFTPELRGYYPLFARVVAAGRVRFGSRVSAAGSLPVTQRLFAGGPESQRGFGRDRLSPFVTKPDGSQIPIGGEVSLEVNAELRIPLFLLFDRQLSLVTFLDGADVVNRIEEFQLPTLHYAAGGGLRYDTPVGPVRGDFGFRLNRRGPGEPDADSSFAIHLSLGEAF